MPFCVFWTAVHAVPGPVAWALASRPGFQPFQYFLNSALTGAENLAKRDAAMTAIEHPRDDEMTDEDLVAAQDHCIETMARLAEFWGFTRTMGRVWCVLFLAPRPMTQADIVERLGISAANVSMSLKGLRRWGAIHKVYEKGSRKLRYTAEAEVKNIIRSVLGTREQRELSDAVSSMDEALELVKDVSGVSPDRSFVSGRIAHLQSTVRISNKILALLLGDGRVDVKAELGER